MKFVKGFEQIVVLIAVITFLFITTLLMFMQLRRLPLSYTIQILDSAGKKIILPDLRLNFRKYEVAESYARVYREMFIQYPYKFTVIGLRK
jgi:hypothetical protein